MMFPHFDFQSFSFGFCMGGVWYTLSHIITDRSKRNREKIEAEEKRKRALLSRILDHNATVRDPRLYVSLPKFGGLPLDVDDAELDRLQELDKQRAR